MDTQGYKQDTFVTLQTNRYPTKQYLPKDVTCNIKIPSQHRLILNISDISFTGSESLHIDINGRTPQRLKGVYFPPMEFEAENQDKAITIDFILKKLSGRTYIRIWISATGKLIYILLISYSLVILSFNACTWVSTKV